MLFRSTGLASVQLQLHLPDSVMFKPWTWTLEWLPSGWQIRAQDVHWPLPTHWLAGLGSPWNTLEPEGQLRLQSHHWSFQIAGMSLQTRGQFTITLERFGTRLSSLKPLGDYQLTVMGANHAPTVDLKTLQGPLQMVGHGSWQPGGFRFEGEAWAHEPQDEPVLFNLLGVLGNRVGSRTVLKVG